MVVNVSTKQMIKDRLMFLRTSEETHANIAEAEKDKNILEQKEGDIKKVWVREVAKNRHKKAEIRTK